MTVFELPPYVTEIMNTLNKGGYEAFIVGGSVRDFLLCKEPKDFDITTNALPAEIKGLFKRTVDTGIRHGTISVLIGKERAEVTTYRVDGRYTDNRRPDNVFFTRSLKEDILRRDFTVNAMAYEPKRGIIDYCGGLEDLNLGIIRCVGEPDKRFEEDALRMLRGARFAAELNFSIEQKTRESIIKNAAKLASISAERVRDEFLRIISAPSADILSFITEAKLLSFFSEPLDNYMRTNLANVQNNLRKLDCPSRKDKTLTLAAFFMMMPQKSVRSELIRLRLDNATVKHANTLVKGLNLPLPANLYETRVYLSQIGAELYTRLITLKRLLTDEDAKNAALMLSRVLDDNDCFNTASLAVNGNDIVSLGAKGKNVGVVLASLLDTVMRDPKMNVREALLNEARALL